MTPDPRFVKRYGPWALVTGASDGIGRAFAGALAERGLNLVLSARRGALLEAQALGLTRAYGVQCRVIAADLGDAEGLTRLRAAISELELGLLVAAAGFGTSGAFVDGELRDERAMLAVNCGATLDLVHAVAPRLRERGRGGIVLLSSIVGFQGVPWAAHYAATKAWVQTFGEGLAVELGARGVDVVVAAPGPVASGFAERAGLKMGRAGSPEVVARGALDALGRRRLVRPGGLAKLLGWSLAGLPRAGRTRVMGLIMGGMTAHRRARDPGR